MVAIDSDVFILEFAFQSDPRQAQNKEFLQRVRSVEPAITVYNLMEILGQLSFNFSPTRLDDWQSWLIEAYQLNVLWPFGAEVSLSALEFRTEIFEHPFAKMRAHRISFLDALILNLAERTPDVTTFVTWNARHFQGKSMLTVVTPAEYVRQTA